MQTGKRPVVLQWQVLTLTLLQYQWKAFYPDNTHTQSSLSTTLAIGCTVSTTQYTSISFHCKHPVKHTHIHLFNSPLSRTTRVSLYQKGKTNLDITNARHSEWQWHQLGHMQTICTSLLTDNHASTTPLSFYKPDALPAAQPTASKDWRHSTKGTTSSENQMPNRRF